MRSSAEDSRSPKALCSAEVRITREESYRHAPAQGNVGAGA